MGFQDSMPDFSATKIVKEFTTGGQPLRILDGVNVELDRGQNLAIVGPSGSGKSTFLHLAGTLDRPTSGSISLLATDVSKLTEKQLPAFRNEQVGFVFQEHHLLPQLTALENVLLPTLATGKSSQSQNDRAQELLEQVGLRDRVHHLPAALSGGERQRVAVARALINEPVLLLADEPTGSLDQENADKIGQLLLDLQAASNAILICVTHSDRLAQRFGQHVRLQNGKFVRD
jgi:lipoprotein-releasing system ATP-binding protein